MENVLLDGGSNVNIMTNELRHKLYLPLPKPTPYNQTTAKHVGLIKDIKISIHGIPYIQLHSLSQRITCWMQLIQCCCAKHPWKMPKFFTIGAQT
jgi:hypothetical protein